MKTKLLILAGLVIVVVGLGITGYYLANRQPLSDKQPIVPTTSAAKAVLAVTEPAKPANPGGRSLKIKSRLTDFSEEEKAEFQKNLEARYKPALKKWSAAFAGRLPFDPEKVSLDNFAERLGRTAVYQEYIFVVDGVTLGIQDANGVARVDYMNDPGQTKKMLALPSGEAPISTLPISRDDLIHILKTEGSMTFSPGDVRTIPSGYSGGLNGGVMVHVGGDPNNAASWKYDLIFDANGKLAFYNKGANSLEK